jgi:hypothetical protein
LQKEMPFFALTPRRRPLLKKRSKTIAKVSASKSQQGGISSPLLFI